MLEHYFGNLKAKHVYNRAEVHIGVSDQIQALKNCN